jgi:hypothetical protein
MEVSSEVSSHEDDIEYPGEGFSISKVSRRRLS